MPRKKATVVAVPAKAAAALSERGDTEFFPGSGTLAAIDQLAVLAFDGGVVPRQNGQPRYTVPQVKLILLKGWELRIPPLQALQGIYIGEDGGFAQGADLMRALITRARAGVIDPVELTDERATVRALRYGEGGRPDIVREFTYTIEDARRATRTGRLPDSMLQHPKGSLFGRVTSLAARALFSHVLLGVSYTPEEIATAAPAPTGVPPGAEPSGSQGENPATMPEKAPPVAVEAPKAAAETQTPTPAAEPAHEASVAPAVPEPEPRSLTLAEQVAARPLDVVFDVRTPQGEVRQLYTHGITPDQFARIKALTMVAGGRPDWQVLQARGKAWCEARGLSGQLVQATEAEAEALIQHMLGQDEPAPTAANGGGMTPEAIIDRVLSAAQLDPGVYRAKIIAFVCESLQVRSLADIPEPQLRQTGAELIAMAKDPQTFELVLARAGGMA